MISLLLVDDEPAILEITGIFLEKSGKIEVKSVLSGEDALKMIATGEFDAIVSDYEMPGMTGIELLKEIRRSGNKIPFIIFTGKGREDVVIEALNEDADYYIQKGGDPKSQFAELLNSVLKAVMLRSSERKIEETNRRLSEIIEFLPEATFAIDTNGVVIEWNLAIEKMTGVLREDMVGKGDYSYSVPFMGKPIPVLINHIINPGHLEVNKKYRIIQEDDTLKSEIFAPNLNDGDGAYLRLKASPLYGPDGEMSGAIESIRDISAMKKTESELLEKKRMLEDMMNNLPGFAYRCLNDPDWTIQFVSAGCESLTGYKPCDFINNANISYGLVIHPDDRKMVWDTIQKSLEKSRQFQISYRIRKKNGDEKRVWEQGKGIFEDGRLVAVEGLVLDVSEKTVSTG